MFKFIKIYFTILNCREKAIGRRYSTDLIWISSKLLKPSSSKNKQMEKTFNVLVETSATTASVQRDYKGPAVACTPSQAGSCCMVYVRRILPLWTHQNFSGNKWQEFHYVSRWCAAQNEWWDSGELSGFIWIDRKTGASLIISFQKKHFPGQRLGKLFDMSPFIWNLFLVSYL